MSFSCRTTYKPLFEQVKNAAQFSESEMQNKNGNKTLANTITKASVVLLCGYFEGYLREMFSEFVNKINDSKINVSLIPDAMISELLTTYVGKKDKFRISEVINSLYSNSEYEINSKPFSETDANPTVDVIDRLFSNIGVEKVLDYVTLKDYSYLGTMYTQESQIDNSLRQKINRELGGIKTDEIISLIEGKWSPKKKRRRIGYIGFIDNLLKHRNCIAHGERIDDISPNDLIGWVQQVESLTDSLVTLLEERYSFIVMDTK